MRTKVRFVQFAMALMVILAAEPARSQSYFQGWNVADSESGNPVPGGSIFGADIISRGIQSNGMYMMLNDTPPTNNFFLAGYFQTFTPGLLDFSGKTLSLDVNQIPVGGIVNPAPSGSFFFMELAFDKNGDGIYTDGIDNTWRTSLASNPFALPGTGGTTYNIALNASNFSVAGDVSGAFDLTKVTRIGFGLLQNVPDNGAANFPDGVNYGWRFDNLAVVPEHGSWAMMILGLAGMAGLLRRKK